MSPFRPQNLNKRLAGPTGGNGGMLGCNVTPYLYGSTSVDPGGRFAGGCCLGRFTLNESYCGVSRGCNSPEVDCKGFLLTPGVWIAPSCAQANYNWYSHASMVTTANSCMGAIGWYVPSVGTMQSYGYPYRNNWDSYSVSAYWVSGRYDINNGYYVSMADGSSGPGNLWSSLPTRAFRNA
jgi:hypothetical protein